MFHSTDDRRGQARAERTSRRARRAAAACNYGTFVPRKDAVPECLERQFPATHLPPRETSNVQEPARIRPHEGSSRLEKNLIAQTLLLRFSSVFTRKQKSNSSFRLFQTKDARRFKAKILYSRIGFV